MKKVLIILALAICSPTLLMSQAKHNNCYGHFNFRGNSLLLPYCARLVGNVPKMIVGAQIGYREGSEGVKKMVNNGTFEKEMENRLQGYYQWVRPTVMYDIHVPSWALYENENKIATEGPDWWRCLLLGDFKHNYNCSVGYTLGWRSYDIPFGMKVGVDYEWRGLCVTEGELAGLHKTSGIVPTATLNWFPLGNGFERNHGWNVVVEGGVSYVKNLTYNDPLQLGKTAVNDGLRGVVAIGYDAVNYLSIRYEWDCYNYFNLPNTTSRMNSLMFTFGHGF